MPPILPATCDRGSADVQLSQAVDDLGGRDLVDAVVAVRGALVHRRGHENRIEGDFPGGVADLAYRFDVSSGLIDRLDITA